METFYVYILKSISSGKLYIGQTNNFERRFQEHLRGKHPSTRNRGPWEVVFVIPRNSRSEAVLLERKLKKMKRPDRIISFAKKLV